MISSGDSLDKFFMRTLILKREFSVSGIGEICRLGKLTFAVPDLQIFASPDIEKII